MTTELSYIFAGIIFGLGAGLTPGPLMTLVFTETIKHGTREGIKISMAPLITDLPIILISLFIISEISELNVILGILSLIGAAYLLFMGYESLIFKGVNIEDSKLKPQSIKRGIFANLLNPNPYVFWVSVGAPLVLKASNVSVVAPYLFIVSMYFCLVGSKVVTAILLGKSRQFLKTKNYIYILRALGIILFIFAVIFVKDGLRFLNIS